MARYKAALAADPPPKKASDKPVHADSSFNANLLLCVPAVEGGSTKGNRRRVSTRPHKLVLMTHLLSRHGIYISGRALNDEFLMRPARFCCPFRQNVLHFII